MQLIINYRDCGRTGPNYLCHNTVDTSTICIILILVDQCGPVWTSVDQCGPVWTSVDQCGPVWTSVDQCGPVWTSVDQCGPMWTIVDQCGPVWTSVDQCGPVWTIVDQCGPVWTRRYQEDKRAHDDVQLGTRRCYIREVILLQSQN